MTIQHIRELLVVFEKNVKNKKRQKSEKVEKYGPRRSAQYFSYFFHFFAAKNSHFPYGLFVVFQAVHQRLWKNHHFALAKQMGSKT